MDDEIKGKGNSVNYKYRMHDPRVGRFFAVDPLASQFPHYAPYSFSGNRVIHKIELEGMEDIYFMDSFENTNGSGEETITRIESTEIGYKILESFRNDVLRQIPKELHHKLPEVPAKGNLDVQQLRESEFFFA